SVLLRDLTSAQAFEKGDEVEAKVREGIGRSRPHEAPRPSIRQDAPTLSTLAKVVVDLLDVVDRTRVLGLLLLLAPARRIAAAVLLVGADPFVETLGIENQKSLRAKLSSIGALFRVRRAHRSSMGRLVRKADYVRAE